MMSTNMTRSSLFKPSLVTLDVSADGSGIGGR